MNGPLHGVVHGNKGRGNVKDLPAESSPDVEDGSVGSAGHGVLTVGAETVGDNALLLEAA